MSFETYAKGRRKMRPFHKCHWTPEEDVLLVELVQKYGPGNWDSIASHIRGRTGKSCRLRWINQLHPNVNKSPFTPEEQQRLIQFQKKYGNRWSTMVKHFPGRTDNQLKNQYHMLVGTYMRSLGAYPYTPPQGGGPIGNYCHVFTPCFTGLPRSFQARSSFPGSSSSAYGKAGICRGNPIMSDANSASLSAIRPVAPPPAGTKKPQFIDFLGVGTS